MISQKAVYLFGQLANKSIVSLFQQRNLLYQYTSQQLTLPNFVQKQQQKKNIGKMISVYCGYDPTADSLHLGNLVSIIMMARLQKIMNLRPIFLLGGATGLIGDPSGKKQQRNLLAQQKVQANLQSISNQIKTIYTKIKEDLQKNSQQYGLSINKDQQTSPIFINNYQFYKNMNVLAYLRDIGKIFRMNNLISKQLVANRLQSQQGLSYTQFSYSILQAYDFYILNKDYNCAMQFGGSDQWGNITNGCDLIRRISKGQSQGYGVTMPLLLTKNGQKFGKSQGNALFLNPNKTATSKIYDYFFNTPDDQAQKLMRIFTFYSPQKIQGIIKQHKLFPQKRVVQRQLAQKVSNWLGSYKNVKQQLMKISVGSLKKKQQKQIDQMYSQLSSQLKGEFKQSEILAKQKFLQDLLVRIGLCKSKNQARKDIQGEGIYLNNEKVPKNCTEIPLPQVFQIHKLKGNYILIRRGKKRCYLLKLQD